MKQQGLYLLFILSTFSSCLENPVMTTGIVNEKEEPTVLTIQITPFSDGDGILVLNGEITSKGKSEIIERGFCWSTVSNNPDINDNIVLVSDTGASFSQELNNASGDTTYYWRAFAKNSYGYDYGEVCSSQTPPIWVAKQELPSDSRGKGAIFLLNNRIYLTCGLKNQGQVVVTDMWEYNIASDQWTQGDSMSFIGVGRIYPACFTIGNLAFVGTGLQPTPLTDKDFYQFNADTKKWTELATPDDFEARYEAAAFGLNGKGYLIGGLSGSGTGLNDVWQYDPVSDSWQKKNNFPVNFYGGISICGNNQAFIGFSDAPESAKTLWEYNDTTDSWNEYAKLPDEITTKIYSGVIVQNTIYIVDGNNSIWTLNMSDTATWKKKSDLPVEFLSEAGGGSGNQTLLTVTNSNTIYVGLGFSKLLYEYHPLWDN